MVHEIMRQHVVKYKNNESNFGKLDDNTELWSCKVSKVESRVKKNIQIEIKCKKKFKIKRYVSMGSRNADSSEDETR